MIQSEDEYEFAGKNLSTKNLAVVLVLVGKSKAP